MRQSVGRKRFASQRFAATSFIGTALAQSQSPISRTPPRTQGTMPSGTDAIRRLNP